MSTFACPISSATTLQETPCSWAHDEYVRRNVSQLVLDTPTVSHVGKTQPRRAVLGEVGFPLPVANTRSRSYKGLTSTFAGANAVYPPRILRLVATVRPGVVMAMIGVGLLVITIAVAA